MKKYIPNQHGAWAMLVVPFLFGMFASQPKWMHLLLFICWLLVYLFTYPLLQLIRTKKTKRFLQPVLVYGIFLTPFLAALLIMEPRLIWFGLPMVPLFLINVYFSRKNRERALLNDIAAVVQFSLMVFISYRIGGGNNWGMAAELFLISVLYFVGTAFYVKTIIRERNNRTFYYLSICYHILFLVLLWFVGPHLLIIPGTVLLSRAIVSPRTKISVKQSGILEIVYSVFITLMVWLAFA